MNAIPLQHAAIPPDLGSSLPSAGGRHVWWEAAIGKARDYLSEVRASAADGECGGVSLLEIPNKVADATAKVIIYNSRSRPEAILICSNPLTPKQVACGTAIAAWAKSALGEAAGAAILEPLAEGDANGLSYAIFPWCHPLRNHKVGWLLQRYGLRQRLLAWMFEKLCLTVRTPTPEETDAAVRRPLKHLANLTDVSEDIRAAAALAVDRHERGLWHPRVSLAHNDLWKGNILLRSTKSLPGLGRQFKFAVIDWAGGRRDGEPFFDLLQLADSFRVEKTRLAQQVMRYCGVLGCEPIDAKGYLLMGLGRIGLSLGYFPKDRYVRLVETRWRQLSTGIAEVRA